ncbi:MAG: B12-binding domain-containing radical SAM protein [Bacillota bacterium]
MSRNCHLVELTADPALTAYSIVLGYLHGTAEADPILREAYRFHKHILLQSTDIDGLTDRLLADMGPEPAVVGFCIYFWNRRPSLEIARRIKERWPRCCVVLGGNDATHQAAPLFAEAPWVDVVVNGEGELIFRNLLRALLEPEPDLAGVRGISYRRPDGQVADNPGEERIQNLDEIPSPILSGVYPPSAFTRTFFMIYETNRGCPFSCAFCYWGGATKTKVRQFSLERVRAELEFLVEHLPNYATIFIADANFGMLKRDYEIASLLVTLAQKHRKRLTIATNWAKNTDQNVVRTAKMLYRNGLLGAITLSAQSFDLDVLQIANRKNISPGYYEELQRSFLADGIPTYTELIWGLPGESVASFKAGVERVIATGGTPVIYPLLLLNNTDYAQPAFREQHRLQTRFLPYRTGNLEAPAEFVVAHEQMTEAEWLHGLGLSMTASLFQKGLAWAILWYLHTRTGARYIDLIETLQGYLEGGAHGLPVVAELYRNYLESYTDAGRFDMAAVLAEVGQTIYMDSLHFQAIMTHILREPDRIRSFLAGCADHLYESLPPERRPSRAEYDAVVAYQSGFLLGWQAFLNKRLVNRSLSLTAALAHEMQEAGLLSVSGELPETGEAHLILRVPPAHRVPWGYKLMGIYNGILRPTNCYGVPLIATSQALAEERGFAG